MTRFTGYAALFDRVDRAGDVFRRGSFGSGEVPLLIEHRGDPIGTARVSEDARGLLVEGVAEGVVVGSGLSVGFVATQARQGGRREILRAALAEVSLVRVPMQAGARVTAVIN